MGQFQLLRSTLYMMLRSRLEPTPVSRLLPRTGSVSGSFKTQPTLVVSRDKRIRVPGTAVLVYDTIRLVYLLLFWTFNRSARLFFLCLFVGRCCRLLFVTGKQEKKQSNWIWKTSILLLTISTSTTAERRKRKMSKEDTIPLEISRRRRRENSDYWFIQRIISKRHVMMIQGKSEN